MKKIKEKLNDLKDDIILNDEQSEIKRFGYTVLALCVLVLVIFLFTKYVINDGDVNIIVFDSYEGQVNYNIASVGTMLGKADEEYYVYLYSSEDTAVPLYQAPAALYTAQEIDDLLPIYYVDLENSLNQEFIATDENPENADATTIEELSLGEVTLIKVKNGKIVKYYNNIEDIEKELAVTE